MILRWLWVALQLLTRIPVPTSWTQPLPIEHYPRGIVAFPWVGVVVGLGGGAVFVGLHGWCGIPLAALASVLTVVLITGGLHLDGLADTCDGIFSARRRERMLDIMRDSRLGTFGGLALVFMVVAKTLVISELALRDTAIIHAMLGAAVSARTAVVLLMYRQRYAREGEGLGNLYIGKISTPHTVLTLMSGAVGVALSTRGAGLLAFGITLLMVFLLGRYLRRRLAGQTGDTLGAAIEVGELVFLLALL